MARPLPVVLALLLAPVLALVGALAVGPRARRPGTPADAARTAFALLPWSRIARPADLDGRWRVPLRRAALQDDALREDALREDALRDDALGDGTTVRVLGLSCGCAGARVAGDVLVVSLAAGRRPAVVRVRLGVRVGGHEAVRTLVLEPCLPPPPHPGLVVTVGPGPAAGRGWARARAVLDGPAPPRLEGAAGLQACVRPRPDGRQEVLLTGRPRPADLRARPVLLTGAGRVPLRIYRAAGSR